MAIYVSVTVIPQQGKSNALRDVLKQVAAHFNNDLPGSTQLLQSMDGQRNRFHLLHRFESLAEFEQHDQKRHHDPDATWLALMQQAGELVAEPNTFHYYSVVE